MKSLVKVFLYLFPRPKFEESDLSRISNVCSDINGMTTLILAFYIVENYFANISTGGAVAVVAAGILYLTIEREALRRGYAAASIFSYALAIGFAFLGLTLLAGSVRHTQSMILCVGAAYVTTALGLRKGLIIIGIYVVFIGCGAYVEVDQMSRSAAIDPHLVRNEMKFVSAGILALLLLAAMCEILREHLIEGTLEAIAERDRAKDLLEQKNAKMTEERLQEFLLSMGILAHEFRTPISALSLSNQYLGAQLRKGEFDIERLLKRLTSDAAILAKMNNHIDSSLVNVEVVHGRNAANDLEVVDMGDLVTKALDSNRDLFLKTGEVERHVVEDAFVRVDRVIIDQVVVNLVSNAIKANRARVTRLPGPQVVVSVEARDSEVVFKVSDQGVGISRENIEKMFTPFFSSGTPGHGLGLAMVKKAVTQMRGTVECRSELGRGTVFEVRFPRVHTTPAPLARRV